MPWGISDVPGVTSAEDSTTMAEWRHRQEQRGGHAHHRQPQQPPPQPPAHPDPSKPEVPEVPDPVDPSRTHHLNILA
ncbi:MAG: hypothetical protein AB7I25_01445 [Vicinamibacterales bacterium]